ncbi:MAG: response regulator [Acidobacteriota bacterium]|nr:response regulator [Acidobacteriota bacterium]
MSPKELRSRRIALGVTVPELARELGITTKELQFMEDGVTPMPPHEQFAQLLSEVETRLATGRWRDCLIVEDDEGVRTLFARCLRAEGLTVDEAADGLAAIDATTACDYRLMLLDLRLPNLSGAEVLARVEKKPNPPSNVIVISSADPDDVREIAGSRTVNAILRKAFAIHHADVVFPALAALVKT